MRYVWLSLYLLAVTFPIHGNEITPKFGPEWTFLAPKERRAGTFASISPLYDWFQDLKPKCEKLGCQHIKFSVESRGGFEAFIHIVLEDDFEIFIGNDVGVYEVNTTPLTKENLKKHGAFIQELVFDGAKARGFLPQERVGGGHIHLDVKTHFRNNTQLMRNFVVDLANNPELFYGPLGFDPLNAPPISILSLEQQERFKNLVHDFDRGAVNWDDFVRIMRDEVYEKSYVNGDELVASAYFNNNHPKFQLLNFEHFPETLEIRGFRPQKSLKHFEELMEIISARISYLSKLDQPLELKLHDHRSKFGYLYDRSTDTHSYRNHITNERMSAKYHQYLTESGLDPSKYSKYLPKEIKRKVKMRGISCIGAFMY